MGTTKAIRRQMNRMKMRISQPEPSPEKCVRIWETMQNDHTEYRPARKHPFKRVDK